MAYNYDYDSFGNPNLQPGHITANRSEFFTGYFSASPIGLTANFAGNAITINPSASYRVTITDYDGTTYTSSLFNVGAVVDQNAFHTWFAGAIAPQFTITTAPNIWNTSGTHTIAVANAPLWIPNPQNMSVRIERLNVSPTFVTLATVSPRNNAGTAQFNAGRFVSNDTAVIQTTNFNNLPPFPVRQQRHNVKVTDVNNFSVSGGLGQILGVAGVYNERQGVMRGPSTGYAVGDRVRVITRGRVLVRASSGANFGGSVNFTPLVELGAGPNVGTLTNISTSTTAVLPADFLQVMETNSYPGLVEVRLKA